MSRLKLFPLLVLAAAVPAAANAQQWDSATTAVVAPGIVHKRLVVNSGPWRINVLEINLRQPGLSVRGVKAKDSFIGRETVTSMAARYQGPGVVAAAVNADFFNVRTGESENNVVIEGVLSKGVTLTDSPYDAFDNLHSQFAVDWKNRPYIERYGLSAALSQGTHSEPLYGINFRPSYGNTMVLYTRAVGDSSPADTTHRQLAYLPLRVVSSSRNTTTYRIAGKVQAGGRIALESGAALSAEGERRQALERIGMRGGQIRVKTALAPGTAELRTVVGGWPRIIRNGRNTAGIANIIEGTRPGFSAGRHPRTAVGISRDSATLYLVTVDGRRESDSGMSLSELADAMLQLGVHDAMNFDGGGSTTMVVQGKLVNRPSDSAGERPVGSALLVVVEDASRIKR